MNLADVPLADGHASPSLVRLHLLQVWALGPDAVTGPALVTLGEILNSTWPAGAWPGEHGWSPGPAPFAWAGLIGRATRAKWRVRTVQTHGTVEWVRRALTRVGRRHPSVPWVLGAGVTHPGGEGRTHLLAGGLVPPLALTDERGEPWARSAYHQLYLNRWLDPDDAVWPLLSWEKVDDNVSSLCEYKWVQHPCWPAVLAWLKAMDMGERWDPSRTTSGARDRL